MVIWSGERVFKPVASKLDVPALEREVIERWRERDTMARYLARNEESERRFSFIDGPITANNPMGVHHAWGRTYKDLYQRYHTMLGEKQRYQNGFDCQGLWIEVEVERELGFNDKRQIEEYGIDRFVELCKERVDKFAAIQTEQSKRLGYWMDWDNSYYTNSDENNYTDLGVPGRVPPARAALPRPRRHAVVPALRDRHQQHGGGRGVRGGEAPVGDPAPADHERRPRGRGPAGVDDHAVDAVEQRRRRGASRPDLPAGRGDRRAALVGERRLEGARGTRRRRWCARRAAPSCVDLTYAGPFDELPAAAGVAHRVIPWDEVSDAEGTGIVHIAPGCGQEDFALSKAFDLPVIDPIDQFGVFAEGFGWQTGRYAGATDDPADDLARAVVADLERKGLLVAKETYAHSYPHCWRCGTQLIFRLVDEWFIAMDPLREPISASTRSMTWLPDGIGLEERELDWLRNMGDWMISKKRYYGLALPIWECTDCDGWEVIGSKEELRERAVAGWDEFEGHSPHRPWVDAVEIACASCGGRGAAHRRRRQSVARCRDRRRSRR